MMYNVNVKAKANPEEGSKKEERKSNVKAEARTRMKEWKKNEKSNRKEKPAAKR